MENLEMIVKKYLVKSVGTMDSQHAPGADICDGRSQLQRGHNKHCELLIIRVITVN